MQKIMKVYSVFLKILVLSILLATNATAESQSWNPQADGLWLKETKNLILLKANLKNHTIGLRVNPKKLNTRSYADEVAKNELNVAVINASFFDPEAFPLGYISRNNQSLNPIHKGGNLLTGIFLIIENNPIIIPRADIEKFKTHELAIQAGPRLLVSGEPTSINSPKQSARSALCINKNKELILASTQSQSRLSLLELQELLLVEADCYDALNLDGGTSSQMLIRRNGKNIINKLSFASVPVHLVLIDN